MGAKLENGIVISNIQIAKDIYSMLIRVPDIANSVEMPGQFINLYPKEKHTILPRPISICEIDNKEETIRIVYQVVGDGTGQFSKLKGGDEIRVSGPIGRGFDVSGDHREHLLVGGGVGIPPLLELSKRLKGNVTVILGFRDEPYLIEDFEKYGAKIYVATESGKYGSKGNVLDILKQEDIKIDMAYSCGPKPMLKALNSWCQEKDIPVQVSLEERMACGIGVCVGCVCKKKDNGNKDGWSYKKTCTDGPVFMGSDVIWDE